MNYTLHQLRVFTKVYEHKSITKAAEELFLTQPAVSIQLKRLQEQFEIPMTEVIGRQLHITEFGERIAQTCYRVLEEAEAINQEINLFKGILTGNIQIATVSTGKYILPYFLRSFIQKYDQVNLNVNVTNKQKVVDALRENETDLALVSVLPDDMKLETVTLMENHLYLVVGKYGPAIDHINSPKKLSDLPLIFRERGSATRMAMEGYLDKMGITPRKTMELVSNEAVKQAVIAGLGLSIMPLIGLESELKNGNIRIIPIKGLPITTTWNLVYNSGKSLDPVLTTFLSELNSEKEAIKKEKFDWIRKYKKS